MRAHVAHAGRSSAKAVGTKLVQPFEKSPQELDWWERDERCRPYERYFPTNYLLLYDAGGTQIAWMQYIRPPAFHFFEKKIILHHFIKLETLSRNSLMSYMHKMFLSLEIKVTTKLPNKFSIVLDGWTGAIPTTSLCSRRILPKHWRDMENFYSDCLPWKTKIPSIQSSITNSSSSFWPFMVNQF